MAELKGLKLAKEMQMIKAARPGSKGKEYARYLEDLAENSRYAGLRRSAKLEEIEAGLVSFEDQFLAYMALPDGSTVGEFMKLPENVERLAKTKMPKLLIGEKL